MLDFLVLLHGVVARDSSAAPDASGRGMGGRIRCVGSSWCAHPQKMKSKNDGSNYDAASGATVGSYLWLALHSRTN